MSQIRKNICSRLSCRHGMVIIRSFQDELPNNINQMMDLDSVLSYRDWKLSECYADDNWTKCKWPEILWKYLNENPEIYDKLKENLEKWKVKYLPGTYLKFYSTTFTKKWQNMKSYKT